MCAVCVEEEDWGSHFDSDGDGDGDGDGATLLDFGVLWCTGFE